MGHRKPFRFQGGRRYLILIPLQPGKPHGLTVQISAGHRALRPYSRENTDFQGGKNLGKISPGHQILAGDGKASTLTQLLGTLSE